MQTILLLKAEVEEFSSIILRLLYTICSTCYFELTQKELY